MTHSEKRKWFRRIREQTEWRKVAERHGYIEVSDNGGYWYQFSKATPEAIEAKLERFSKEASSMDTEAIVERVAAWEVSEEWSPPWVRRVGGGSFDDALDEFVEVLRKQVAKKVRTGRMSEFEATTFMRDRIDDWRSSWIPDLMFVDERGHGMGPSW